ncbi:MAG: AMP-binding protein, partial [Myxococcales bacterium]|nr:AMP-binding protein [Myxococcales bacterium]
MPVWNPNAIIDIRSEADIAAIEALGFDALTRANSVYEILAIQAQERPSDAAVVFIPTADPEGPALRITYAQLFARVTQAANLFAELSGDAKPVVGILLPSLPQAHIALWGAAAAGVAVPVNFLLGVEPLAELFTSAGVTVLVALGPHPVVDIWSKAQVLAERVPTIKALVQVTGEAADGVVDFDRAVAAQPHDALRSAREFARDDVVAYFHTGGTTGAPKLATHSNRNHLAMAFGVGRSWGFEPGEGVMNGLPIFHVGGALCAGLAPLAWGAFMLLVTPAGLRNPEVIRNIWRLTEKHRLAAIGGVPTSIVAMQQVPLDGADISSVRMAITGGSPTPPGPAEAFEARFGVGIHQVYGMTETAGNGVVGPRHAPRVAGSAGLRTAFTELRTVRLGANGPTDEDCEPGEAGLLLVRGPTTTPGYTDPARDAEVLLADGWLSTGDLARIDPDGRVWVT